MLSPESPSLFLLAGTGFQLSYISHKKDCLLREMGSIARSSVRCYTSSPSSNPNIDKDRKSGRHLRKICYHRQKTMELFILLIFKFPSSYFDFPSLLFEFFLSLIIWSPILFRAPLWRVLIPSVIPPPPATRFTFGRGERLVSLILLG